jgi:micrococcal nuclease
VDATFHAGRRGDPAPTKPGTKIPSLKGDCVVIRRRPNHKRTYDTDSLPRREREFRIKTNSAILIIFLFFLALSSGAAAEIYHARVVKVFDGDTFLVRLQGRKEYVRLREIDAPEISRRKQAGQEPWAKRAREFALAGVKNRLLRLEVEERDERDAYHRLLAYVFAGDLLVNEELIQSGHALFYPGRFRGRYSSRLEKAEGAARKKGVGVWDRKNGLQERPRDFRDRNQKDESLFSPSRPGGTHGRINHRDRGERREEAHSNIQNGKLK